MDYSTPKGKMFPCLAAVVMVYVLVLYAFTTIYINDAFFVVVLPVSEMESSRQLETPPPINKRSTDSQLYTTMTFTPMKFGPAYVLSSAVTNSSFRSRLDVIHVYASMYDAILRYTNVSCCLKFKGETTFDYIKVPVTVISSPLKKQPLSSYFYECQSAKPGTIPYGVGITVDELGCSEDDHVTYIHPMVPQKQGSGVTMALCNKGAFGSVSPELIIEWMETYKYLGVDKVSTYFLDELNEAAKKVLYYYSSIGFVDLYKFIPAMEDLMPRNYTISDGQSMSDRQMTVFDCHDRMSGYTYYGIMDHDEFLIPSGNRTLKKLMADLYRNHSTAAGFTFTAMHYFLPFGTTRTTNDLIIGQYITQAVQFGKLKSHKTIYKPRYIRPGGAHTHHPEPVDGKLRVLATYEEGFLRHVRNSCYSPDCRKERIHNTLNDTWLSDWSRRIENNVRNVRKAVFGTEQMMHLP